MRGAGFIFRLVLIVAVLGATRPAAAQLTQVARFEREHKGSDSGWTIISLKSKGIALVRDNEKYRDGRKVIEMLLLDTALNESSSVEFEVHSRMIIIGYEYSSDRYIDLLFREGENEQQADVLLIEFDLRTKEYIKFEIKNEFNFKATHFTVLERNAIFGGYVNREPAVIIYDKELKQLKVVPGFFASDTELLDLRVNQNGTFNTLVINRSGLPEKSLLLRTFDKTGAQLMEDHIPLDQSKTVLSAITSSLVRDELLIAGTYAVGNSKQSSGFFSVVADPFTEQPVYYHDFPKLGHFLEYMNPKRSEKIKTVSERNRLHGKDPDFRASVSNIRLEEYPEGFFLLAEVYNATSNNNNTSMYPYQSAGYGSPYSNSYASPFSSRGSYNPFSSRYYNSPYSYGQPVSSSIKVIQSTVVVFRPDGKLEWDHSARVDGTDRDVLEQVSDFWCDKNKIVIATKMESDLTSKARFKNDESVSDTTSILLKNPSDVVRDESHGEGGVRHWFSNTLYVWGYQTLKDPTAEDRIRNVFYIVKVDAN